MKKFIVKVVMVAVALGASLAAAGKCSAGELDLRRGSFEANWCGFNARIDVQKKIGNTWKFEGKILLHATGQYDKITIEQLADNHLHMVRFLSGAHAGDTQVMVTYPPEVVGSRVNFPARRVEGFGTKLLGFIKMPRN